MERGDIEQVIIGQCQKSGTALPPKIANAPELALGLDIYLQAFYELNSCRAVGFSAGPIPWRDIATYAAICGFEGDQEFALFHHVRALDIVYLQHQQTSSKGSPGGKRTSISAKAPG